MQNLWGVRDHSELLKVKNWSENYGGGGGVNFLFKFSPSFGKDIQRPAYEMIEESLGYKNILVSQF